MIPYIGITDFCSYKQVKAMEEVFYGDPITFSKRLLHVGVMMSFKTLHDIPTKWSTCFPKKEQLPKIFSSLTAYNCLHYADYDNMPNFWRSMCAAITHCGPRLRAVQLDMIWPDPFEIAHAVQASGRNIEVILQIGQFALDRVQNDPKALVKKLRNYKQAIHRVLLDKSMGQGKSMDAQVLLPFIRSIHRELPMFGIGVAGGLGPETLHLVKPIVEEFPNISIDAQGQLRASGNALDPIDWTRAREYLVRAKQLFT